MGSRRKIVQVLIAGSSRNQVWCRFLIVRVSGAALPGAIVNGRNCERVNAVVARTRIGTLFTAAFLAASEMLTQSTDAGDGAVAPEVTTSGPDARGQQSGAPAEPAETAKPEATNDAAEGDDKEKPRRNFQTKTLGGRQFWADVAHFHQWRIQENVLTRHYRLLDGADVRHAWGTLQQCRDALQAIRNERKLPPMEGEAVILLHGILRSSKSMLPMRQHLTDAGYQTFSFDYPSTQVDIAQSAEYLHHVVESLEGVEKIHFVAHSMGGLVVRAYLGAHQDSRIGRLVMIATPNQGAELADLLKTNSLYRLIYGPAGQQLITPVTGAFIGDLAVPNVDFAVIAGGRLTDSGYNPFITGDDDGTVSVSSTRLAGASDSCVLPHLHSFLVRSPACQAATTLFLKEGRLQEDGPHPIPKPPVKQP